MSAATPSLTEVKIDDVALELSAGAQSMMASTFWRARDGAS
jgi:hypothetical protein